jgi:hypothetical protein
MGARAGAAASAIAGTLCPDRARAEPWWWSRQVTDGMAVGWCRAVASAPDHMDELPARGRYHPFEDIPEAAKLDDGEPAHLTDAESARTIVEVAT